MIRYSGIHHLAMVTSNMDRTIRFWRDMLGMRLVAGLGRPGYRHYFFEISDHDLIAFFEWPDVKSVDLKDHGVPVKGPLVFDHVSFEVQNDDDLWELKDRLEAASMWVSEIIDHGFIHSIYTFDPNQIAIEFSAPVEGIDVRKHPVNRDSSPSGVASEGSESQSGHWPEPDHPTPEEDRKVYPGEGRILVTERQ